MKALKTYSYRGHSGFLVLLVYILISLYSCVMAQSFQRITHSGLEFSTGVRGFCPDAWADGSIRSQTRGFSAGFVTGNNLVRFRIRPIGYYESTNSVSRAFSMLESEALINFYPLEFLRTRKNVLDVYAIMGVNVQRVIYKDRHLFVQGIASDEEREFLSLDHVTALRQSVGIGVEYHLPLAFAHVFCEMLFSNSVYQSSHNPLFIQSWTNDQTAINLGIRLGTRRSVRTPKFYPG